MEISGYTRKDAGNQIENLHKKRIKIHSVF